MFVFAISVTCLCHIVSIRFHGFHEDSDEHSNDGRDSKIGCLLLSLNYYDACSAPRCHRRSDSAA